MADMESRKVWTVEEVNTIFRLITGYSDDKERINTNIDLFGREEACQKWIPLPHTSGKLRLIGLWKQQTITQSEEENSI